MRLTTKEKNIIYTEIYTRINIVKENIEIEESHKKYYENGHNEIKKAYVDELKQLEKLEQKLRSWF